MVRIMAGDENDTNSLIPTSKNKIEAYAEYGEMVDYDLSFSGFDENYCVSIVDMVDSTKISATMDRAKLSKYYSTFLNSMASIVKKHGGKVIKNVGDSLLYFFPDVARSSDDFEFISCLESGLDMIEERANINLKLKKENLPPLSYRISSDYGNVLLAKSQNSPVVDIFGPSVNICCKINGKAEKNGVVIGADLYQIVKKFSNYYFKDIGSYDVGLRKQYPIYSVTRA